MDLEDYMVKANFAEKELEKAKKVIDNQNVKIQELEKEVQVMYKKVMYAEEREANMNQNMVKAITDSNAKINLYVEKIQMLQALVKGLKEEINGNND